MFLSSRVKGVHSISPGGLKSGVACGCGLTGKCVVAGSRCLSIATVFPVLCSPASSPRYTK